MQSERVQLDEQARVKDIELNRLKSVKMELEQDLRDCRQNVERVSYCCPSWLVCSLCTFLKLFPLGRPAEWPNICDCEHKSAMEIYASTPDA